MSKGKKGSHKTYKPLIIKSIDVLAKEIEEKSSNVKAVSKVDALEVDDQEKAFVEKEKFHKLRKISAEADKMEQDNEGRSVLRDAIFIVTVCWMGGVMYTVWKVGGGQIRLSDTVLVTLITTTTANVFAFLYVVVKYLFNDNKSS